jgi:glycosyltransferase involved in cell wall biosynthesis
MSGERIIQALLVDPSLFTAPYDTALTQRLLAAGVEVTWATRPTRRGERQEIPIERVDAFFYPWVDEAAYLPRHVRAVTKGLSHLIGLCGLVVRVLKHKPDIVHLQWTVLPYLDALAILIMRRRRPVILTVHDPVPFNGERLSWLQTLGSDLPIRLADRVIVHTCSGRQTLMKRGVPAEKVTVIPHGPLRLSVPLPEKRADTSSNEDRRTFVLFGEIKPYKGADRLVEAMGLLPEPTRRKARVIVAGRPRMDLSPIIARIAELNLGDTVEVRPQRLSEEEFATLFREADCFVFPYRQIDASGVYFLVKSLGKWMIASRVGIFAEDLQEGTQGALVPAKDIKALSQALEFALHAQPKPPPVALEDTWAAIGNATRNLYTQALATRTKSTIAAETLANP